MALISKINRAGSKAVGAGRTGLFEAILCDDPVHLFAPERLPRRPG